MWRSMVSVAGSHPLPLALPPLASWCPSELQPLLESGQRAVGPAEVRPASQILPLARHTRPELLDFSTSSSPIAHASASACTSLSRLRAIYRSGTFPCARAS